MHACLETRRQQATARKQQEGEGKQDAIQLCRPLPASHTGRLLPLSDQTDSRRKCGRQERQDSRLTTSASLIRCAFLQDSSRTTVAVAELVCAFRKSNKNEGARVQHLQREVTMREGEHVGALPSQ